MVGYNGNKGGVETYIDQLAAALPQYEIIYSLPVMEIDGKVWQRPRNRHHYISYRIFWHSFFKRNHFDVLYFNVCDVMDIDMLIFAKRARIPIRIIHAHNSGTEMALEGKMRLFHRLNERHNRRVLDRYATHLLACSHVAGDWMFDGRPFTVVKNGIQISRYSFCEENRRTLRQSLGLNGDELLVGIVGRISPQKNPSFSVKVLQALLRKEPTASAVFLGDGQLRGQTEESVKDAGIQERVHFLGNVDNVNEWMSAMDVLLLPSLFEGLPFVLVEAQASGLPCVVSEAVSREADITGLVHFMGKDESADKWADAIIMKRALSRPDTRQQLTEAGYSIENTARTISDIIMT